MLKIKAVDSTGGDISSESLRNFTIIIHDKGSTNWTNAYALYRDGYFILENLNVRKKPGVYELWVAAVLAENGVSYQVC